MTLDPSFTVKASSPSGDALLFAMASPGLAGLTALDYLREHAPGTALGYVSTHQYPDIVPVTDGRPRHPLRLYDLADGPALLLSEVFVPMFAADPFVDGLADWLETTDVTEVTVVTGASFPHDESQHHAFYAGTDDHRDARVADAVASLPGGFFDGVTAECLTRSLEGRFPPAGAVTTPVHPPGPDLEAAIVLLETLEFLYGIDVDESALRDRLAEFEQYYESLGQRMQALRESDREYPEDRMFM